MKLLLKNTTDINTTASGDLTLGTAEVYNHYWDNGFTIDNKVVSRIEPT